MFTYVENYAQGGNANRPLFLCEARKEKKIQFFSTPLESDKIHILC